MNVFKNKILLLLPLLVLASCGNISSQQTDSSLTDGPSLSQNPPISSQEPPTTSEEPLSSEDSTDPDGLEFNVDYSSILWPSEAVAFILNHDPISVPAFVTDNGFSYVLIDGADGKYLFMVSEGGSIDDEATYTTQLEELNWTIDDSQYDVYGYIATDPTETAGMYYYWYEDQFVWVIFRLDEGPMIGEVESQLWPTEEIATFLGEEVNISIPALISPNPFYYTIGSTDQYTYFYLYSEMTAEVSDSGYTDVEDQYNALLTAANWTVDDSDYANSGFFALDETETILLQYYWWEGSFELMIFLNEEVNPGPVEIESEHQAIFEFSSLDQIVSKASSLVKWEEAEASMTIEKGTSNENVGNNQDDRLMNPLRVYTNQIVHFEVASGYVIEGIVILVNDLKTDYLDNLSESYFTNADISTSGQYVTIIPQDQTKPVIIDIYAQTRFDSLVVYYSSL